MAIQELSPINQEVNVRNSQVDREIQALWALALQKIAFAKRLEGPLAIRVHNPLTHCLMIEAGELLTKANSLTVRPY